MASAAPLVDGGNRKAEYERAREAVVEKVQLYRKAVLEALAEVEDALVREHEQAAYLTHLARQLELARAVADKTELAYSAGAANYLSVLTAQSSLQSLERRMLAAQRSLLDYRIALYRSLAGGWDMEPPASS